MAAVKQTHRSSPTSALGPLSWVVSRHVPSSSVRKPAPMNGFTQLTVRMPYLAPLSANGSGGRGSNPAVPIDLQRLTRWGAERGGEGTGPA